MGKRGPAKKPTAIKEAQGTVRNKSLAAKEPRFGDITSVDRPATLTGYAAEAWDFLYPQLTTAGVLQVSDVMMLEELCKHSALCRQLQDELDYIRANTDHPELPNSIVSKDGTPRVIPHIESIAKRRMELKRMLGEFGLTPAARANVSVEKKSASQEARERFGWGGGR